jgi:CHAT domain-containing protein
VLRSSFKVEPDGLAGPGDTKAVAEAVPVSSGGRDLLHIVLIPTGRLSLLPLHAAQYAVDGRDGCFLDEFVVSYAISATALSKARQEAQLRGNAPLRLVGVGNPLPEFADGAVDRPGSLPFARAELESIAEMLPDGAARVFYEHNANRQILVDALPGANLVHLSCHGRFRADDPLASGLLLADGKLTLRDIIAAGFTALAKTRLAVLSACQTAIQDFRNLPDEAIGLPAGFTQAGVPSVLGTLWSVNDASTAFLMVRFYELLLQDRLPPPVAMRQAQLWLRDATNTELDAYLSRHEAIALARRQPTARMPMTAVHALLSQVLKGDPNERPYAHPYHWAPFVFYGAEEPV